MRLAIREGCVDADGLRIRYQEAGEGPPLVHLHGAYGLGFTSAHELLSRAFRVIAFEMPGFGPTENQKTQTVDDLAMTMTAAAEALGLSRFNLIGSSFGGTVASWMALQRSELVAALVLDAPSMIQPEGSEPVSGSPEQIARRLYAHPERAPSGVDPAMVARRLTFVQQLTSPARDALLEEGLRRWKIPTLVMFGTQDGVIPARMG